jgi:hypothetical protein
LFQKLVRCGIAESAGFRATDRLIFDPEYRKVMVWLNNMEETVSSANERVDRMIERSLSILLADLKRL